MPPSRSLIQNRGILFYLKELGLFFFRFGVCPLCITASVGYGFYRLFKAVRLRFKAGPEARRAASFVLLVLSASSGFAQPKVQQGQSAPAFSVRDVYDNEVSLAAMKGQKVLLSFMRNAGCPVCNFHVHELLAKSDSLKARNIAVVLIYQSTKENMLTYLEQEKLPFVFVADPENKLCDLYGIENGMGKMMEGMFRGAMGKMKKGKRLFKSKVKQDGSKTTIGADFLLDESGKVLQAHYGRHLGDHLPIADIAKLQ